MIHDKTNKENNVLLSHNNDDYDESTGSLSCVRNYDNKNKNKDDCNTDKDNKHNTQEQEVNAQRSFR